MNVTGGIALVAVLLVAAAAPAAAQTGRHHAADTVVETDGTFHPLASVRITADEGDRFYVAARMQTKSATQGPTHNMLVALLLGCADGLPELRSTQNIHYGQDVLTHQGRYLFTAPHDGVFECRLQARGGIHGPQSDPPARFTVDGAHSYLAVSGRQPSWARQTYQGQQRLIRSGRERNIANLAFTAPDDVARFSATADIEMTNCYNDGYLCDTVPGNKLPSVVRTRLLVMQKDRGGGYCRVTRWPASGPKTTVITRRQHHKKAYHRVADVPVSTRASCTRDFRVAVHTRVVSGNDLMIEMGPYTNTFVRG